MNSHCILVTVAYMNPQVPVKRVMRVFYNELRHRWVLKVEVRVLVQCISTQDKHAGEEGNVTEGGSGRGTEAVGVS